MIENEQFFPNIEVYALAMSRDEILTLCESLSYV